MFEIGPAGGTALCGVAGVGVAVFVGTMVAVFVAVLVALELVVFFAVPAVAVFVALFVGVFVAAFVLVGALVGVLVAVFSNFGVAVRVGVRVARASLMLSVLRFELDAASTVAVDATTTSKTDRAAIISFFEFIPGLPSLSSSVGTETPRAHRAAKGGARSLMQGEGSEGVVGVRPGDFRVSGPKPWVFTYLSGGRIKRGRGRCQPGAEWVLVRSAGSASSRRRSEQQLAEAEGGSSLLFRKESGLLLRDSSPARYDAPIGAL